MKKFISLILVMLIVISFAVGCVDENDKKDRNETDNAEETENVADRTDDIKVNKWDGSVASSYEGGEGTESAPYKIASGSQLAFLAAQVNSGEAYSGKYFELVSDIDLDNVEWTSIGNESKGFSGIFDGKDHLISNLKITNTRLIDEVGLFGTCFDSTLKNLRINGAEIIIQDPFSDDFYMAGILAGHVRSNNNIEISNITVSDSKIITLEEDTYRRLNIGGICGCVTGDSKASCTISRIQSDVYVSIENGSAQSNIVGGIIGEMGVYDSLEVKNCVSYLSVDVNESKSDTEENCFGAFGSLTARAETKDATVLTNIFSKVTINRIHNYVNDISRSTVNSIAGKVDYGKVTAGIYQFKNLFGFVEQIDEETDERATTMKLYDIYYEILYSETNCQSCEELPENHGFDTKIWDVDDLSKPKLKLN